MNYAYITWNLIFLLSTLGVHLKLNAEAYDPSASVFLFQKQMAKRGNAESQYKLGLMYETGSGVNNSTALATSWYKKAARQSYKPASNRLTYLEIKRSGFDDTHEKWLKDLKTEARFNDGEALFLLGQMYSEGTGVNKSLTRSLKYLRKAAGGNIPGSEAEINRVETELALLQKQYITEEEKQKTIPIIALPVQKALKVNPSPVVPAVTSRIIPSTKSIKKNPIKKTTKRKKVTTQSRLKQPSSPEKVQMTTTSKKLEKSPMAKTPVVKLKPVVEPHPMDTICGGRNRFSRGCR